MKTKMMGLAFLLATSGITGMAMAQDDKPCRRIEKLQKWMNDSLGLSADQQARIAVINDSACMKIQAVKAKNNSDKEANKGDIQKIMQNAREGYKTVLTDAQIQKMQAHAKDRRKGRKMDPEKRSEKMTLRMKSELGLSDDQTLKVKAANEELARRMKGLKEKRDAGTDKVELKSTAKLIHSEYDAKVKAILNAEQVAKWEKIKADAKARHKQKRAKNR